SSGIAHDFNNLLGIMLGNISLAQSHLPPAHAAMNNIEKALTAMERAAELTKQMLAYSGKGKFQVRTIDLVAVVKEHASLFNVSLPKNVKLETRLSTEPVYINGDPGQIEQIIMNLIINGGDAIGEAQGVVSVTLETCVMDADELAPYGRIANTVLPSGAYACLEVRDNGIGMSRETMRKIFDPFFTTKFTGRGLGLSAVLGILQGHKGGLIVDSTEGKGTMFRLILPLCDAPDSGNQPSSEEIAPPALATTTILVIDDEADIAEMAQEILETAEYQVLVSLNPVEGVALFAREWSRIGLVLLDLTMPEMSGKEVVEKLQAILPDVKIIISSGYTQEEVAKRIGSLKVSAFIHKPYRLNALLSVVENVLR
ncbi:MAG TPA: response regulator, partial [Bacteroidota bacterium]|nr:response regulator [Bacteroidota bacterium]